MSDALLATLGAHARRASIGRVASSKLGIVTSADPNAYAVKVRLQPEDVLSGWLPVTAEWTGSGWGDFCLPLPGDQVRVSFQEGDSGAGIVVGKVYSDEQRPPTGALAGERWLMHQSGSLIRLRNNGNVEIVGAADLPVTVAGNVTLAVTGNVTITAAALTITGDTTIDGDLTITGTVIGGEKGVNLDTHVHTNVQAGTSLSGPPPAP